MTLLMRDKEHERKGEEKGYEKGRAEERAAYAARESGYLSRIAELEARLAMQG